MSKPQIFVSCGQRTDSEKQLAQQICKLIQDDGRFDFFFAEFQHSLHGLNENILDALERATAFVTVMHGRGQVSYDTSGTSSLTRASVWIEQEIAIAAYIQRTAKKQLLTAAYIEFGVGREGIRDLLHLNPTVFKTPTEVIADLKERLSMWHPPQPKVRSEDDFGKLELRHTPQYEAHVGRVVRLAPFLTNKSSRVKEYACALEVPIQLLSWTSTSYYIEVQGTKTGYRKFRVTEANKNEPILKDQTVEMLGLAVSITHLTGAERELVLSLSVSVVAEMETHSYELSYPCRDIFRDPVPTI